ncbi:MAG: polysaccharide biosynthesis tyrosine autokinase [Muribaculaceae bacterium]|nr:polysaccharide biosynthesis tyrosine autokinase [Muribaculaceae bacterium]
MAKEHDTQNDIIDIPGLLQEYGRKWYLFVICIVVCVGAALIYVQNRQPIYEVHANLLISQDEEKGGSLGIKAVFSDVTSMFGAKGNVDDEVFLVSSHSVFRDAIKEMGINKKHYVHNGLFQKVFTYKDYPIDVTADPGIADTLMSKIRFKVSVDADGSVKTKVKVDGKKIGTFKADKLPQTIKTDWGTFVINKTAAFPAGDDVTETIMFSGYNPAAEDIDEELNIFISNKKANVIALNTQSTDTEYAKDLLNTVIEQYNKRAVRDRNIKSQKTRDFIDARLEMLTSDLADTENELENYKKRTNMTDLSAEVANEMLKQSTLEQELIKSQAQEEIFKMLQDYASDPENKHSLMPSTTATAESSQGSINNYNALILQRLDLTMDGSKANNIQIKKLDEQIEMMRKSMIASIEKDRQSAHLTSRELARKVAESDSELRTVPTKEKEWRNIYRQRELKEDLYLFLLQRREETSMTLANSISKGVVVDEAFSLAEPRGISNAMVLSLALILGIILAPIILYVRRLTRNKFETKDELEKISKVPMLGEVCTSRSKDTLVVRPGGSTSVAELFRLIRTNLQFILNNENDKVILMTSTVSGEGKSFVSINLASSLALLGKKVLLVGMDIRAPKLAEYLPLTPKFGLTEYLSRTDIPLDDIILKSPVQEGMDIITAGPVPPNPSELLLSSRVDELFAQLRTMYDYIIVDSAPVGMVSDSFALSRISDATVYVCRANYTTLRDVRFFNDLYSENRLKKMSLVVNGTSARKGYGYGYGQQQDGKKHKKHSK